MLKELEQLATFSLTAGQMLENILVALLCGVLVALAYRTCFRGRLYSASFSHSLVLLSLITTLVIMVIGSNLARAFGLVGAMSIIRFRTAVKDTQEIMFIFFALAVGMATGAGLSAIAITGTVVVGAIAIILSRMPTAMSGRKEFLLQFVYRGRPDAEAGYLRVMKANTASTKLLNMRAMESDEGLELSFHVRLRDGGRAAQLVHDLKALGTIDHLNLYFDEEHT